VARPPPASPAWLPRASATHAAASVPWPASGPHRRRARPSPTSPPGQATVPPQQPVGCRVHPRVPRSTSRATRTSDPRVSRQVRHRCARRCAHRRGGERRGDLARGLRPGTLRDREDGMCP
jgi:hypothetical protein